MAMRKSAAYLFALAALGIATFARANIPGDLITDGDFESDTGTNGGSVGQNNGAAPGWTQTVSLVGVLAPGLVTSGSFYSGADLSDNGTYIGFTQGNGATYSNISTNTYAADTTYTVTSLFGNSYEAATGDVGTFELLDGTTKVVLATDPVLTPAADKTKSVTFSYDTELTGIGVGDPIEFQFIETSPSNKTLAFDNVDVTGASDAVPEPASLSLLAIGGVGLLTRRRRRA
jgi:hypothetical protein